MLLNFCRRGQEGLHDLKSNSYIKCTDDVGNQYYKMAYNEANKTHYGVDSKENQQETRMYSRPGEQNCPASSMDLYLGKLNPKCKAFFQQHLQYPKQECCYAAQAMMFRISKNANMSRRYTNHCITATVATVLKREGVDLLSIMSVTGHRNVKSLDSYIVTLTGPRIMSVE